MSIKQEFSGRLFSGHMLQAMRRLPQALALALGVSGSAVAWAAPQEVQVWHTLTGRNQAEFDKLAADYNKSQANVRVVLRGFNGEDELARETAMAIAGKYAPQLVQISDQHSPEVIAEHAAILPMHQLLATHPIRDQAWFLPQASSFVRDGRGRLLAFPWMAEVPVMFYNIDAYRKAGLNPAQPARTWNDLQNELAQLYERTDLQCAYATGDPLTVHLENLAPVNGKLYATADNGLGRGKPSLNFDVLYMRHISLMASWKRGHLMTEFPNDNEANLAFARGRCGVLTTGSGALGELMASNTLSFGVAPLPYYSQVTSQPGKPFISGSALWALKGHDRGSDAATASFLAYLATPVVAAEWHQKTGYLPLTQAAFLAADVSFYDRIPGTQKLIASLESAPTVASRGFRLPNYPQVAVVLNDALAAALSGQRPAMEALQSAVRQGNALMK
ncbi:extracellular solute-binding protein [Kerstersia similis]|uniref:extracellular solute-binding protein n=1 Tax=Kerstersia similis TaxID=206505 RepID=UPI0039F068AD